VLQNNILIEENIVKLIFKDEDLGEEIL